MRSNVFGRVVENEHTHGCVSAHPPQHKGSPGSPCLGGPSDVRSALSQIRTSFFASHSPTRHAYAVPLMAHGCPLGSYAVQDSFFASLSPPCLVDTRHLWLTVVHRSALTQYKTPSSPRSRLHDQLALGHSGLRAGITFLIHLYYAESCSCFSCALCGCFACIR